MKTDGLSGESMKGFKNFKVFYFLSNDRPYFNEPHRNWELIMARSDDEAEEIFKLVYNEKLSNGEISFGWVEEVVP